MDYPKNTIYPKASNIDKYYSCRDPKGYFKIDNYFSELTDDVQRVQCLSNLGISNLKHEWGNIQGDINLQQDLIQLINKNISESIHTGTSNLLSKEEFTKAIGDLTNSAGYIHGLEGNSQLEGVADMFEGNACELATLLLTQDKYLENKIDSSSKTIQSEISSIQDDIKLVTANPIVSREPFASELIENEENIGNVVELTQDSYDIRCYKITPEIGPWFNNEEILCYYSDSQRRKDPNNIVLYTDVLLSNILYTYDDTQVFGKCSNSYVKLELFVEGIGTLGLVDFDKENSIHYKAGLYRLINGELQSITEGHYSYLQNYLTKSHINEYYAKKESIPTKTSQLENDSEYVKRFILNIDNIAPGVSGTLTKNTWDKITGDYLVCVNSIGDEYLFNNVQIAGNSNERFIYFRDHINKKDVEIFISFNYLNNTGNYTIKLS